MCVREFIEYYALLVNIWRILCTIAKQMSNEQLWTHFGYTEKCVEKADFWVNCYFAIRSVDKRLEKVNSFLKEIGSVIDFELLRPVLAKNKIGTKNTCGNKAYDSLIMLKILLLFPVRRSSWTITLDG